MTGPRRLIVLVDDDDDIRALLTLNLATVPELVVHEFSNARAALASDAIEAADVILTDYLMPGVDGAEFARAVRLRNRDARIIVITAAADEPYEHYPDLREIRDLLGVKIYSKPISMADLEVLLSGPPEEVFGDDD